MGSHGRDFASGSAWVGSGILSETTVVSEGGRLRLTYDRIARGITSVQIRADIVPTSESSNEVRLWIDGRIIRAMLIEDITPEPSSVVAADGGYSYTFTIQAAGQPATIVFHGTILERGLIRGRAGTMPGGSVDLWQVVLP
jgi:hypothetical protein